MKPLIYNSQPHKKYSFGHFRKKLLLLSVCIASIAFQQIHAQIITTQMTLSARPTSQLANWANYPQILNYIVTYQSAMGNYTVKIVATFKDGTGNVIGTSDLNLLPNRKLQQGTTVLQSKDVILLQSIHFTNSIQRNLITSGRLPEGNYQLSLKIIDAETLKPLTDETMRPFTVLGYQLPILMAPQNESVLSAEQARVAITFRWTPLAPPPSQERITYLLQIFEILEGQTPMQAFRSNWPLLNQQVKGTTQFIWHPQLYFADSSQNRKFIWTIQTVDSDGYGFNNGVGDGRSEPFWFEIKSAKEILNDRKE
ncbi:MAG: hypothetical protein ABI208_01880 [Ginsengibacter sp.]|jgi:hypothetical protein